LYVDVVAAVVTYFSTDYALYIPALLDLVSVGGNAKAVQMPQLIALRV
jgi:hypothetical protein